MSKLRLLLVSSAILFAFFSANSADAQSQTAACGAQNAPSVPTKICKFGQSAHEAKKAEDVNTGQAKQNVGTLMTLNPAADLPAAVTAMTAGSLAQAIVKAEADKKKQQADDDRKGAVEATNDLQNKADAADKEVEACRQMPAQCNLSQREDEAKKAHEALEQAKKALDEADSVAKETEKERKEVYEPAQSAADNIYRQTIDYGQQTGQCNGMGICLGSGFLGNPTSSPSSPPAPVSSDIYGGGGFDPSPSEETPSRLADTYSAPASQYSAATPSSGSPAGAASGGATGGSSPSSASNSNSSSTPSNSSPAASAASAPAASGSSSSSNPFTPIATAAGVTPSAAPLSVNSSADSNELYCRVNPTGPNCPSTIQPAVKASQAKVNGDDYDNSSSGSKTAFDNIANQALPRQLGQAGQIPQNQNTTGLPSLSNNPGDTAGRPGLATSSARGAALKAALSSGSGFYGGSSGSAISANSTARSAAGRAPHTSSRFSRPGMRLASSSPVGSRLNAQMGQMISRFPASTSPEVGKDGFTGPHTDLWRKVRNRYYDQSGSLNP